MIAENIEQATHKSTDNWYKFFSGINSFFYAFFIFSILQCTFSLSFSGNNNIFESVLCVVYSVLAVASLLFGLLVSSLGMEHSRKMKKASKFYRYILLYYFLGIVMVLIFKIF